MEINSVFQAVANHFRSTMKLFRKVLAFGAVFLAPRKSFKKPRKVDVLIYDKTGSNSLIPFLQKYDYAVLNVRGETINVYCLLKCLFKKKFWTESSFETYIFCYVNIVLPKVVITFIDNDFRFYKIAANCPSTKTIFIQNGRRAILNDVFEKLETHKDFKVDYMLVAGEAIGKKYREFIDGEVIPIGSLRNNQVENSSNIDERKILFISSWSEKPKRGLPFRTLIDGTTVSWDDYFNIEEKVLIFLDHWCAQNNKVLQICARESGSLNGEEEYYAKRLGSCTWEFLARYGNSSTYEYLSKSHIVVFIDSTVGYEALSRGKRTAAFVCRVIGKPHKSESFGWPADLPDSGSFWTIESSEKEFERIMDYLNSIGDREWAAECRNLIPQIMAFDEGNKHLEELLNELLPSRD